jgi:SAM-dependent methyltransferase
MGQGYGVDPILSQSQRGPGFTLYPGKFPDDLPALECDLITLLAVLEHVPPDQQKDLVAACHQMLRPKGRVVITVPSPAVDDILRLLSALKIIDGMSLEEHYGFDAESTADLFQGTFELVHRRRFQLGLNNLFVFEKSA